ncbi:MAG: hypothetical protein ACRC41_07845 [Sarcina sp.]
MKIAFLDLEFTRKPYDKTFVNEIIEISCRTTSLEDSYELNNNNYIVSKYKVSENDTTKFNIIVKPSINTFLTKEIIEYTRLTQRQVDSGVNLEEAIEELYAFIRKQDIKRIFIYSRYCKDLLTSAKKILRGRLDIKINYILNIMKDISYYSSDAREKLISNISNSMNTLHTKEALIGKKKFSLSDTYCILLGKKEVNTGITCKSLSDTKLIKDIFFSRSKNVEMELSEIAYGIEIKRDKLTNYILGKKDSIELICSAEKAEDLIDYKNEDLPKIIKSILIVIKEFKTKIIQQGSISLGSINRNDKWLNLYTLAMSLAKDINSKYGLKVKSIKECMDILLRNETEVQNVEVDARLTSILMSSDDDFIRFKEDIKELDSEMIEKLVAKCKDVLKNYNKGHAFKVYSTKLSILTQKQA